MKINAYSCKNYIRIVIIFKKRYYSLECNIIDDKTIAQKHVIPREMSYLLYPRKEYHTKNQWDKIYNRDDN